MYNESNRAGDAHPYLLVFIAMKKYALYLIRWQLSTPVLAICLHYLAGLGEFWATVVANLIGGLIFFWVDKKIFKK